MHITKMKVPSDNRGWAEGVAVAVIENFKVYGLAEN